MVADVFREQFFAPVWSCEAGFDRHLRNGESPNRIPVLSDAWTASGASLLSLVITTKCPGHPRQLPYHHGRPKVSHLG